MSSLIWKEWHEQRWKLVFGSIILSGLALIGLRARIVADGTLLSWVCFLGMVLLPVLSSTGLVPAERGDGTLRSLLALPVSPRRILLAKTLIGLVLCAGPLAAAALVSMAAAGGREISNVAIIGMFARTSATALSLFTWMLVLTIRLPGEGRAGLLSLGVLIFWALATAGLFQASLLIQWGRFGHAPRLTAVAGLWAVSPFVFTFGYTTASNIAGASLSPICPFAAVVVQAAIGVVLWLWAARELSIEPGAVS